MKHRGCVLPWSVPSNGSLMVTWGWICIHRFSWGFLWMIVETQTGVPGAFPCVQVPINPPAIAAIGGEQVHSDTIVFRLLTQLKYSLTCFQHFSTSYPACCSFYASALSQALLTPILAQCLKTPEKNSFSFIIIEPLISSGNNLPTYSR